MSKRKKIFTKVEKIKPKLQLFNLDSIKKIPTKLKGKIGKRAFYEDLRFYIVSLYLLLLVASVTLIMNFGNNYLYNYGSIQALVGWVFGFFTLSISIYALILKFTKSTTISFYIQDNVRVKSLAIIFSLIYSVEIILLIHFETNQIEIIYLVQWTLFMIPHLLLMFMIIVKIIIPLLKATTTMQSISFFKKYSNLVRKDFKQLYNKQLKKSENELKQQIQGVENSKDKKSQNLIKAMNYNLESLSSIQLGVTAKNFDKYFERINTDAINIMFEVKDSSKYADPKIFRALGKIASPPYLRYNYVRDNIIIKLNLAREDNIEYDSCILDFLEGFTLTCLNSPYLNRIMAYELESILNIMEKISYNKIQNKKQSNLYDKSFQFYLKIAKKISQLIKKDEYNTGNPLIRMIERMGSIEATHLSKNKVVQEVQLYRITELIKLDIPLQLKLILFNSLKQVLNRIRDVQFSGPYIFSIFQKLFPAILQIHNLENIRYDPTKIKEESTIKENGRIIHKRNLYIYSTKYNGQLLRWLDETVNYLFKLYKNHLEELKDNKNFKSQPYIEQFNRLFIDLVYYLFTLQPTEKFDAEFFVETNILKIVNNLISIGENLIQSKDSTEYYKYPLAALIVISVLIIEIKPNSKVFEIFENNKNNFLILTKFGLNLITRTRENKILYPLDTKVVTKIHELIQNTFLDKYEMPVIHFKGKTIVGDSIETRPGNWEVVGFQMGYFIGEISLILSQEQEVLKYLSEFED